MKPKSILDTAVNLEVAFGEDSTREPIATEDAEQMIIRYMTRMNLPRAEIEELIADVQENFGGGESPASSPDVAATINRICNFLATLGMIPTDCLVLLLRNGRLISCENQQDIAERHSKDPEAKANVSKWMKKIQRTTGIKPTPGMRKDVSAMIESRNQQLK